MPSLSRPGYEANTVQTSLTHLHTHELQFTGSDPFTDVKELHKLDDEFIWEDVLRAFGVYESLQLNRDKSFGCLSRIRWQRLVSIACVLEKSGI